MKVNVDHDRCEGHGKCAMAAPEVFELRDDDLSYVLVDDVPESLREQVERAIRLCPRQAIDWVQVGAAR
jgi:ferredoxin